MQPWPYINVLNNIERQKIRCAFNIYYRNPALSTRRNKSPIIRFDSVWLTVYITQKNFVGIEEEVFVLQKKLRNFDREKYLLATRRNLQETFKKLRVYTIKIVR